MDYITARIAVTAPLAIAERGYAYDVTVTATALRAFIAAHDDQSQRHAREIQGYKDAMAQCRCDCLPADDRDDR